MHLGGNHRWVPRGRGRAGGGRGQERKGREVGDLKGWEVGEKGVNNTTTLLSCNQRLKGRSQVKQGRVQVTEGRRFGLPCPSS